MEKAGFLYFEVEAPQRDQLKDYRDHNFPNTEFSYFLTIDTRQ